MLQDPSIENDINNLRSFIETYWSKSSANDLKQLTWNQSLLNDTKYRHITHNRSFPGPDESMNDGTESQKPLNRHLLLLETKNWLDLMTLTMDGTIFFVNLILSCYFIYRICHVINPRSNDVINSLILHKSLIGVIIGIGFTLFDIFLIFSSANSPIYKSILRKIQINISWSSLCFLKLNFSEIMMTCYLYYVVTMLIVISKASIIPQRLNRRWKLFLAFLHGIPWILVFLVQLLLYIVSTFQESSRMQFEKVTPCNFLLRNNLFSLFFEGLLISFPVLFALVLLVFYLFKFSTALSQSSSQNLIGSIDNSISVNHMSVKCQDFPLKELDFPNDVVPYRSARSNRVSSTREDYSLTDKPLILAVSVLLIACRCPIIITRIIMNVYWIFEMSLKLMHFISAICTFIDLCLFSLHPLLVLIYTAWRDGAEISSSVDGRRKSDFNNSYQSVNRDDLDEVPLQGVPMHDPDNMKYMMTSV